MMGVSATAPGKVILLGEYSVLAGEPALAMAVSRAARVDVSGGSGGPRSVSAPSLNLPAATFCLNVDGTIRWPGDANQDYGLLQAVVSVLAKNAALQLPPGVEIRLDSAAMYAKDRDGRPVKMGIGSSAALITALASALVHFAGAPEWDDKTWLTLLIEAHRLFQKGEGSGVDIATSFCGGVIEYRRVNDHPCVNRLSLPAELKTVFVWSGHAASTAGLLRRLRCWQQGHSAECAEIMRQLGTTVAAASAAAADNNCADFVAAAGRFASVLADLGERANLSIFSPAHLELATLAKKSGLVYKPCGAGAGDLGVAMGTDASDVKRFTALVKNSKYQIIDISSNPAGVQTIRSQ